jgi:hypothetical protein
MSDNDVAAGGRVVAVLLADGWHRIVPGSFRTGPLGFGAGADHGVPGFRFEEADGGRPYQPTALAGPLDSIIAVRQVAPAVRAVSDPDRAGAAGGGQRTGHAARLSVPAGRPVARIQQM